jgi:putative peptidoglycan lipid II flippase
MFFFLGRDILVRVFYALGDGKTPFKVSIVNIFVNLTLDFLLWKPLGAPGISLSTVGVNITTFTIFLIILNKRLHGLPWADLGFPLFGIFGASSIAGCATWAMSYGWQQLFPQGNFFTLVLQLVIPGAIGLGIFSLIATQLGIAELDILVERLQKKFKKG